MIHNDPDLPTIQKFHYLKGCVTGDAANIISSLETSTENYKVAWDLIKNRYHNKKFIIDSHVKSLFEMPCMSKDFSIRALYDKTQKHIRALRALSVEVDKWDSIIIHLIKGKLNNYIIEKWEESTSNEDLPTLQNILDFLERRSQIEETRAAINQAQNQKALNPKFNSNSRQGSRSQFHFTGATTASPASSNSSQTNNNAFKISCYICEGEHGVYACSQFLNLSPKERYEAAKRISLCPNCLRGNHHLKNCVSSGRRKCGKRHNSLSHFENPRSENHSNPSASQPNQPDNSKHPNSAPVSSYQFAIPSQVVLATAVVDVLDSQGNSCPCRIMLDSPPQSSMRQMSQSSLVIQIYYVICHFSLFKRSNLFLADPDFHIPAEIDMILGAQYFYHFLRTGKISIVVHIAVFQGTEFGWVVAGTFNHKRVKESKIYCNYTNFSDLSLLWELNSPTSTSSRSKEEEACEMNYTKTTHRNKSGRYTVQLPFNNKIFDLGESRRAALIRFQSLENKFKKDPALREQY
ncbi:uncharacterized protein LOC117182536, partial [Belonocnema kinseyi]|uniref:uncharacterized protein LOC117182536 n=1 Tax=Belonocnema kinseyi TaxID=2817044 RepID=UPI00143DEDF5